MCGQLGYDILALTETHDSSCIRSTKHFITGDAAPRGDPCAGVAMLFSDRIAERLWPITNRLYIGIVPMGVISLQKLCEMVCDLSTLGQTLRPRASKLRVEVPSTIKTSA